ncbi:uncharacterized protein LOC109364920, partial [Meleagris gallopavo]|uniref:uncharacterized protein LOC109364920 n=1 Tax=Meleagris gallopavo TaxID=9103 RepID=UPI00093B81CF
MRAGVRLPGSRWPCWAATWRAASSSWVSAVPAVPAVPPHLGTLGGTVSPGSGLGSAWWHRGALHRAVPGGTAPRLLSPCHPGALSHFGGTVVTSPCATSAVPKAPWGTQPCLVAPCHFVPRLLSPCHPRDQAMLGSTVSPHIVPYLLSPCHPRDQAMPGGTVVTSHCATSAVPKAPWGTEPCLVALCHLTLCHVCCPHVTLGHSAILVAPCHLTSCHACCPHVTLRTRPCLVAPCHLTLCHACCPHVTLRTRPCLVALCHLTLCHACCPHVPLVQAVPGDAATSGGFPSPHPHLRGHPTPTHIPQPPAPLCIE